VSKQKIFGKPYSVCCEKLLRFFTVSNRIVDAVMKQAKGAGAKIVKAAGNAFWGGYSGYFQDPDGHLWEIVWNPQMKIEE